MFSVAWNCFSSVWSTSHVIQSKFDLVGPIVARHLRSLNVQMLHGSLRAAAVPAPSWSIKTASHHLKGALMLPLSLLQALAGPDGSTGLVM